MELEGRELITFDCPKCQNHSVGIVVKPVFAQNDKQRIQKCLFCGTETYIGDGFQFDQARTNKTIEERVQYIENNFPHRPHMDIFGFWR